MTWDQDYLRDKRILVIGCGGLAHAALPYLLSSGIGNATLFDGDTVEASNLNRQHLFTPNDIGRNKALVLKEYCAPHFPNATVSGEERMFDVLNKEQSFDLVFDFTDRLATKLELAKHFEKQHIPFFYAAAQMNAGSSAFIHINSITAEMLFGHISDSNKVERDCAIDGVWPTVVAAVGIHVAHQALQFLTLSPCAFVGAIDYFDGVSGLWSRFHFNPKQASPKPEIVLSDLLKDRSTPIFFLGEADDLPSEILSITASELKEEIEKLNRPCILLCETGMRAKAAAEQLSKQFNFPILSWNQNLDSFLLLLNEAHV
ncbi:MAG: putative adenylyltransferase ThiF [Bacteroidota bacterium]|jgi:adenylyltransferase/sulfurtransferase